MVNYYQVQHLRVGMASSYNATGRFRSIFVVKAGTPFMSTIQKVSVSVIGHRIPHAKLYVGRQSLLSLITLSC